MKTGVIEAEDTVTTYALQVKVNGRWANLAGHDRYEDLDELRRVYAEWFAGAEAEYRWVKVVTTQWQQVIGP